MIKEIHSGNRFNTGVQHSLSRMQAIPGLGPLIASPIKAAVSTIQMVGSLLGAVFSAAGALLTSPLLLFGINWSKSAGSASLTCLKEAGKGLGHLAYSTVNIATLGAIALALEGGRKEPTD